MKAFVASNLHENISTSKRIVSFSKKELSSILRIYCKMVAQGEWRDYGIYMSENSSIFLIYRYSSEYPIYKVKKFFNLTNKFMIYSIIEMNGNILKTGKSLENVLKVLEKKMFKVIK